MGGVKTSKKEDFPVTLATYGKTMDDKFLKLFPTQMNFQLLKKSYSKHAAMAYRIIHFN